MAEEVVVEFACDADGDHTSPEYLCTESRSKPFKSLKKALIFINKCSKVYNLDEILGAVPEAAPKKSKKVLKFQ